MLRDLAEGLVMETKAFRYIMRVLLVLFLMGVTAPMLFVMEYVGNRAMHGYCQSMAPAVQRSAVSAEKPPPQMKCPTIRLRT